MELFSDAGSIPAISTKQVLDEHLLLLRRIRSKSFDLILLTKTPFWETKAVFLCLIEHFLRYNYLAKEVITL